MIEFVFLARGGHSYNDRSGGSGFDNDTRGKHHYDVLRVLIIVFFNFYFEVCYNCNQSGHISRECPEPRKDSRGGASGNRGGFSNDRSGFSSGGGARGGFSSGGDSNGRGGFTSGNSGRNINFGTSSNDGTTSMSITLSNTRNQHNGNNANGDDKNRTAPAAWQSIQNNRPTNGDDSTETHRPSVFTNSLIRKSSGLQGKQINCVA